ncbi:MAG: hypothetical protein IJZ59_01555 [Alphaproteobacteria bacterium]|nr:hypothetical protein [Alphaproteobacteria bacterium]
MGLRTWFLTTAAVIGLGGNVQAGELSEKQDAPEGHKIELSVQETPKQTNAVDELITGEYKGINFEVVHSTYQVNPVSKKDSILYHKMIENTAERNSWPVEVAENVSSRAVAFNMIYKYSRDDMKAVFFEQDRKFTNKLSDDLEYIDKSGAEAYMNNILKPEAKKTIDFDNVRAQTQQKYTTPSGITYSFDKEGRIAMQGNVGGGYINRLLPKYESEKSSKTSPTGFYIAYINDKGYYQCGGSIAQTANAARMTETRKLQQIYMYDEICKDLQNRMNNGDELSSFEKAFMERHQQQLKKRGIVHDEKGNMTLSQQAPMKNKFRGRS